MKPILQSSNNNYQSFILDTLPESILVLDMQKVLIYQNHRARGLFLLEDQSELTDQALCRVFQINDTDLQYIIVQLRENQHWQGQVTGIYNGAEKRLSHYIDILPGAPPYLLITTMDFTEEPLKYRKTELFNIEKIQVLANISHELRTPMIGILGSVDLLKGTPLDEYQIENINIIQQCSEQLLGIIGEILDISKMDMGLVPVTPEPCEIRGLISKAFHVIEPILHTKGLRLQISIEESIPAILMFDQDKLHQVLTHILINAAKFTDRGGIYLKASLEKSAKGDRLFIMVTDTGRGIAQNQLKHIFEPFSQIDASTTREHGGTGLGLYFCKRLLELMRGGIRIDSQPGDGTTVYVHLPISQISEDSLQNGLSSFNEAACEQDIRLEFKPSRILLVEDHHLNRKIITQMLHNYGFIVTAVNNGLECLQALHRDSFDAILMDIQMPIMDGYETTRIIRQDPALGAMPIIAMTANSTVGEREKCLFCGCSSFIAKPFKAAELAQELRQQMMSVPLLNRHGFDESIVKALLPEFLQNLTEMIADLSRAWKRRDMALLQSIAHDIKGSAGLYGLISISQAAAQLQQASRNQDTQQIGFALRDLKHYQTEAILAMQSNISIG